MKKTLLLTAGLLVSLVALAQKQIEYHLNEKYPLGKDGTIYLKSHDATVTIIGENREDVSVQVDFTQVIKGFGGGSRSFNMEVNANGDDLRITEVREGKSAMVGSVKSTYTIVVRAPLSSHWNIIGDDDSYNISKINGHISINGDDADVLLTDCGGKKFFFDLDDGNLSMDKARGEMTIKIDDGDVDIRNSTLDKINFRGDDGQFKLQTVLGHNTYFKLSGDDTHFDINITKGGGTFTIKHDSGKINYDDKFVVKDKSENLTTLSLTGGLAKVILSGDDIRVNLTGPQ